ncbi:hypothetical protein SUGI_0548260 [Cryptomeria japonica]|nr:hypothetical protein SUGI_0548260 [Cryptomeria japonica]
MNTCSDYVKLKDKTFGLFKSFRTVYICVLQMSSLIKIDGEKDVEQGLVELDEEQRIGVLDIDEGKREPMIAELDSAFKGLEKFECLMLITSIIFLFIVVLRVLTDSDKERAPIAFTIFLASTFSSILVGIIIRFGRVLHTKKIGPALPTKKVMLIGNVLLCTSEGFFMVSIFAAGYLLVSFKLRWLAIGMALVVWILLLATLALFYTFVEFRLGFEVVTVLTSLAIVFRFGGLYMVLFYSRMT